MTFYLHRQIASTPSVGPRVPPALANAETQRRNAKTQRRKDAKEFGNWILTGGNRESGNSVSHFLRFPTEDAADTEKNEKPETGNSKLFSPIRHSAFRTPHLTAFSLVEILVTMALLSVIVLGLLAMFHQTQRAFTQSLMQVDVLEGGRAATDLMSHELEQMTPAYTSNSNGNPYFGANCYVFVDPNAVSVFQPLTVQPEVRTNVIEKLFFLTRYNQQWKGIGYIVGNTGPTNGSPDGLGTLYRWDSSFSTFGTNDIPGNLLNDFQQEPDTNRFQRIASGVIHFRVRAYQTNGFYLSTNSLVFVKIYPNIFGVQNKVAPPGTFPTLEMSYLFYSNAVPASVELELGFLETRALEQYHSMQGSPIARNFLKGHAGQVHVFTKRVQIRNVDAAAYR